MQKKILCVLLGMLGSTAMADPYQLAQSKAEDIRIIIDNATKETWCQPKVHFRFQGGANATEEGMATLFSKLDKVFAKTGCANIETLTWEFLNANQQQVLFGESTKASAWAYNPQRYGQQAPATQETAAAPATQAPVAPPAPPAVKLDYFPFGNFKVGAFTPPTEEERKKLFEGFVTKPNQTGCKIYSKFDLGSQEEYTQFQTENIKCDDKGFLHGIGIIRASRSDGASLMDNTNITFNHGLVFGDPFSKIAPETLAYVKAGRYGSNSQYLFGVGSDEKLKTHYLLGTELGFYHGLGFFSLDRAYVLVDNLEDFKHADKLKLRVDAAINQFSKVLAPTTRSLEINFIDNLPLYFEDSSRSLIYTIAFGRDMEWTSHGHVPVGPWKVKDYSVKNYAFQREARAAEEKAREEERKRQEERARLERLAAEQSVLLDDYEKIEKANISSVDDAQRYLYNNASSGNYRYEKLLSGESIGISTIVHINKQEEHYAYSDWPYPMKIEDVYGILKEGWYAIQGRQSLDFSQLDSEGLPLTVVVNIHKHTYACQEDKCADLQNPLTMMKFLYGVENWDPEEARKIIKQAQE